MFNFLSESSDVPKVVTVPKEKTYIQFQLTLVGSNFTNIHHSRSLIIFDEDYVNIDIARMIYKSFETKMADDSVSYVVLNDGLVALYVLKSTIHEFRFDSKRIKHDEEPKARITTYSEYLAQEAAKTQKADDGCSATGSDSTSGESTGCKTD